MLFPSSRQTSNSDEAGARAASARELVVASWPLVSSLYMIILSLGEASAGVVGAPGEVQVVGVLPLCREPVAVKAVPKPTDMQVVRLE